MVSYCEYKGKKFRILLYDENGAWMICGDGKTKPRYMSREVMKQTTPAAAPIPQESTTISQKRQKTKKKRLEIIQSLIKDQRCIWDTEYRKKLICDSSKENSTSERTIARYYWAYLAQGENGLLPETKNPDSPKTAEHMCMTQALNKYYYSPRKMSLKMTYQMMISDSYRKEDGTIMETIPTYNQFEYYFYKYRNIRRCITAREGRMEYKKNYRPVTGSGDNGIKNIGVYEMDATQADIYLVSRYDRCVIGRPVIYLAVDVASRLIAGIYVGFDETSNAVLSCLANAAEDKVEYCQRYGIDINPEDWPSCQLPSMIVTDRGRDFISDRTKEMCLAFGMETTSLPAYRPDLKGYVEKSFDCIQKRYKPLLYGCGVIEKNTSGRNAPDYRLDARLDIEEFTAVIIQCVLYYNNGRIIDTFSRTPEMVRDDLVPISTNVWRWLAAHKYDSRIPVNAEDVYLRLLPRDKAVISRHGVRFKNLYYTNNEIEEQLVKSGVSGVKEIDVAYDAEQTNRIYWIRNGMYESLDLTSSSAAYADLSFAEIEQVSQQEKEIRKSADSQILQVGVSTNESILNIRRNAEKRVHEKRELAEQKQRREREKNGRS
mgnify:CR=1 FL=1